MQRFINGLVLGLILGVGGFWIYTQASQRVEVQGAQKRLQESVQQTAAQVETSLAAKLEALELQAGPIKEEPAQSGNIAQLSVNHSLYGIVGRHG